MFTPYVPLPVSQDWLVLIEYPVHSQVLIGRRCTLAGFCRLMTATYVLHGNVAAPFVSDKTWAAWFFGWATLLPLQLLVPCSCVFVDRKDSTPSHARLGTATAATILLYYWATAPRLACR
jgi:hypothetical protein